MGRVQKRKSISVRPTSYETAKRSASREGVAVSAWVERAIDAHADPDLEGLTDVDLDASGATSKGSTWRTG